jgi:uncharacterized protein YutE (UPF0331/DUF86 family)
MVRSSAAATGADRLGPIFGFPNRVVHIYDRNDDRLVYDILTRDRPDLEELARLLLDALSTLPESGG